MKRAADLSCIFIVWKLWPWGHRLTSHLRYAKPTAGIMSEVSRSELIRKLLTGRREKNLWQLQVSSLLTNQNMINVSHKVCGTKPPFSWMDLQTPQQMINQRLPRAEKKKTFWKCRRLSALILMSSPVGLHITIKDLFYFPRPLYSPSALDAYCQTEVCVTI